MIRHPAPGMIRRCIPYVYCLILAMAALGLGRASDVPDMTMFRGDAQGTGNYSAKPVYALDGVRFTFKTGAAIRSTPALANGVLYFGSGDKNFYAIDARSGTERWRFNTGGAVNSSPAISNNQVYFSSRDGYLYALSTDAGREKWKFKLGKDLGDDNYWDFYLSSPILIGDRLYIGSGAGRLYAIDARSGRLAWTFDAGSRIRSTPAMTSEELVFGTMDGHVVALRLSDGSQLWKFATKGASNHFADVGNDTTSLFTSPSIADGVVTIGGRDAYIYGLDLATGAQIWRTTHDGSSWILSTAIKDHALYVGSGSALIVQAAELKSGVELWRFKTTGAVFSSLTLAGDVIYFSDFAGNIYAVNRLTGVEYWRFPMGQRSLSTPVLGDGVVYCAADDGVLYALDGSTDSRRAPAKPVRRVVYWEGKKNEKAFSWFANDIDITIRSYFEAAGYERMNAVQLAQFMTRESAGDARSVVVFADNKIPASVVRVDSDRATIRQYLNAGGKVAVFGPNPLAYRPDPKTGEVEKADFDVPRRVFGIRFPELARVNGFYVSNTTSVGERWGLRGTFVGIDPIEPAEASAVLALDEFGMASSWVKSYGGREGTGLLQLTIPRSTPADLAPFLAAVERGL
jgi:outer membrane protein assembly factor BamB